MLILIILFNFSCGLSTNLKNKSNLVENNINELSDLCDEMEYIIDSIKSVHIDNYRYSKDEIDAQTAEIMNFEINGSKILYSMICALICDDTKSLINLTLGIDFTKLKTKCGNDVLSFAVFLLREKSIIYLIENVKENEISNDKFLELIIIILIHINQNPFECKRVILDKIIELRPSILNQKYMENYIIIYTSLSDDLEMFRYILNHKLFILPKDTIKENELLIHMFCLSTLDNSGSIYQYYNTPKNYMYLSERELKILICTEQVPIYLNKI